MDTVKVIVENMARSQGIEKIKFTSKKGETLAQQDWIGGTDYETLNDLTNEENDEDDHTEDDVEDATNEEQTIRIVESVVENEETCKVDNNNLDDVIDDLIDDLDELNNGVISEGAKKLNDITAESEEGTEDPVEQFSRPTRERNEPERWTYHQRNENYKVEIMRTEQDDKHTQCQQLVSEEIIKPVRRSYCQVLRGDK